MDINQTNEEIGSLLYKIEEQFARLLQQGTQISMLETDIAIRDIQKLYERFQDLRAYAANRRVSVDEPVVTKARIFESPKVDLMDEQAKQTENIALPADENEAKIEEIAEKLHELIVEPEKIVEQKVEEPIKIELQPAEIEAEEKQEPKAEVKVEAVIESLAPIKKEEVPKSNDWQRTFESKTNIPEQVTAPKKDLLQERERDFVPTVRKIELKPEPIGADANKKETLFDKAASLYDKIAKPIDKSIASQASKQPISNIKAAIGINEKFTYLKELFKNNITDYNESLEKLNNFDNYAAAEDYFQELKSKFNWNPDSKSFQGLADLMGRRYL